MAHIFHHRQAICGNSLPDSAAHAHRLDSGNHLGCLCAESVQYGQENSGCYEKVVRTCYGVTLNGDITRLSTRQASIKMKPSHALQLHRTEIRCVVESHHARNARVFGSVLRGRDTDSSDLDILIDPTSETTLMDVAAIQVELQRILGVSVDVLTPKALPETFRSVVLAQAVPI